MASRPRVLILGARGMLGHALAQEFASYSPTLRDVAELDITDAAAVNAAFRDLRPTLVLNAAAATDVDGCEEREATALRVNGDGVANLARACAACGAALVHYSTDYVFDGANERGYREDAAPSPINAYGRTKLAGERALLSSGAEFLLLRTSWLFGPHGRNFVDTMLRLANEQDELTVVADQTGMPTYTRDLARRTRELLERGERGTHHAANPPPTTWYEFARAILALAGIATPVRPITSSSLARKAKRPAWSILLNTKDPPMRPWQEAVAEYVESRVPATPEAQES